MNRRLLLVALALTVGGFIWLLNSFPPAAITARFVGRTNYPGGWIGCLLAVTNVTSNAVTVLVPMDLNKSNRTKVSPVPTNVFLCPVQVPARDGKVLAFLQTQANQRKIQVHFGQQRDYSGLGYRIRRWLRLPRGQPRDFLSSPQTLVLELPPG